MGSIQSCKIAIGYRAPMEREGCHTCANVRNGSADHPASRYRTSYLECGLHGFMVAALAICKKHAPKGVAHAAEQVESRVDCGECPAISAGCEAGHCMKGGAA
jgi:hypothetical protein